MKLLIAEDDPLFRKMLHRLLHSDFELMIAKDGKQAWEIIQQNRWPLMAILDWVMPGLSGPEICREARAHPHTAGTYMILLTSRNSPEDIVAGLRAGADDYVTKPFEAEDLRARVRLGRRIVELQVSLKAQTATVQQLQSRGKWAQSDDRSSNERPILKAAPAGGYSR